MTTWSGRAAGALLALALGAGPARAQEPDEPAEPEEEVDYQTGSGSWNGLSTFEALAHGMGLEVSQESSIAWDDLERGDILVLIYPTTKLDSSHLAGFLQNGGRLLVADDFGRSEEALASLGILRGTGIGVRADDYYDGHAYAPVARPVAPGHPLALGVDSLTANHPSVWNATRGARSIFGFEGGDSLVAAIEMGEGRLVALADPSVLINRMLEFDGNLTFAINLLRYLSRPGESDRMVILSGDLSMLGEPSRMLGEGGPGGVVGLLGDFNRWLLGLNEYLLTETGMRVLAAGIALLIAGVALVWLPRARQTPLDGSWTRARGGPPELPGPEQVLAEVDRPGRRSYALPAAVVRDSINARLALLTGHPDPLHGMPEHDLYAALESRVPRAAIQKLGALYASLHALPSRSQAVSPWTAPFYPQRDFERLNAAANQLYRSLEEES
ncbi:MAG TPA: DUF4350 domain-containing protein [Kofleriaceae bacterium]|nr:DUF4350 domain-containing protein [Kofleriaceae bacterium]